MVIEQQHLLAGNTTLALRAHGLYICKKEINGHNAVEVEMPYEEILPIRAERRNLVPTRMLFMVFWGLLAFGVRYLPSDENPSDNFWFAAFAAGIGFGLFVYYGVNNWWRKFIISTSRTVITLSDRGGQQAELQSFVYVLERRTKEYLRHHYGQVNPLGAIDLQLGRLRWLRELDVLNEAEARALSVRLTGRHDETLQGMGHALEAPYVN